MRFTPAAANSATVNDFPLIPTMKLNGFLAAAHTAREYSWKRVGRETAAFYERLRGLPR